MDFGRISRRHLLQGSAVLTLGTAFGARSAHAADTTIGFIYVGSRDDYGYNQAHAQGAAALKKMLGLKVIEEEKVPETDAVEKTMESMINLDGATLLFPTSFGYFSPHVLKLANKYPKARFQHAGGLWTEKDPKNVGSYFGYIDEAQHVAGIVAGHSTKTGKLGFVAAKPIPQLLRNVNAFILGAGTWFSWQNTLSRAAPVILTALCTALPAQLGLVIIGGDGALLLGALAATSAALIVQSAPSLVVQLAM